METKVFKKLVLASLLLGASSIVTAAEKNDTPKDRLRARQLTEAARHGNLEVIRAIIEGESSSWSMSMLSRLGVLPYLCPHDPSDDIVYPLYLNTTPFIIAAEYGHTDVVRYFIQMGTDVNQATPFNETALHWAIRNGHAETVQVLLAADAYPNYLDHSGNSCLYGAIIRKNVTIIQALLATGAPLYTGDPRGTTPLQAAAFRGHTETVQALIDANASPNIADYNVNTPLYLAAQNGHTETIQTLLMANATIDITNRRRESSLLTAAEHGQTETVQALIDARANIDLADDNNNTALHMSTVNGFTEVVRTLLHAGATTNTINDDGETPLIWATERGLTDIVQLLINAYRDSLIKQFPAIVHAQSREPNGLLEQTLPAEVIQLIPAWLEPKNLASFRSASTGCRLYAGHEFRKEQAAYLKQKLITFIESALEVASKNLSLEEKVKEKIIALLRQELENAQQLNVLAQVPACQALAGAGTPSIACSARAVMNSDDDEGAAGPPEDQHTGCVLVRRQAEEARGGIEDGAPFYGCAIARQQRNAELARQQQNTTAAAVAIAADRALRTQQDEEYAASLAADQERDRVRAAQEALALVAVTPIGIVSQEESEDEADAPSMQDLRARRLAALDPSNGGEK